MDSCAGRQLGGEPRSSARASVSTIASTRAMLLPAPDAAGEGTGCWRPEPPTRCSDQAEASQFPAPALRVPMAAAVRIVLRDDDEMPHADADLVVAARASVRLVALHLTDIETGSRCPRRRVRSAHGWLRRHVEAAIAAIAPRHQPSTLRMNATVSGASDAPMSRSSRLTPLTRKE